MEEKILPIALRNAIKYNGKANPKAVLGIFLSENPEYRSKAKEIMPVIENVVEEVNKLPLDEIKKKLEELGENTEDRKLELEELKNIYKK